MSFFDTGWGNYPPGVTDNDPHFDNWDERDEDDTEERRMFDEAQELLKQDAEAYWKFLIELDRELNQTEREDAQRDSSANREVP
jgi:hypothetical protein